ncbi:hypothetical protein [Streptomyces sp. Adlamb9]|uniref:hypothetical protein n=1 Tax=Streptomyces sp. Adlamb9 TaxID=3400629 RepID=UPI003F1A8A70
MGAVDGDLGLAVLVVVPFLSGSARAEAGSPPTELSAGISTAGATPALAASLYATAKASDALARRLGAGAEAA